jgi:hypothetical protein
MMLSCLFMMLGGILVIFCRHTLEF